MPAYQPTRLQPYGNSWRPELAGLIPENGFRSRMYSFFRPLLFRLEPEQAHSLTLRLLRLAGSLRPLRAFLQAWFAAPAMPVKAFGLSFNNPVGLAAGYDKDGLGWRGLACLGFGHIEIGTVTPRQQPGNPKPRLFRLVSERALINRMGFPGKGAGFVAAQLQGRGPPGLVLGVNLGKNKDTPLDLAARDYLELLGKFAPLADYLAINVSSPNTVGLRRLQRRQSLEQLLEVLARARKSQEQRLGRGVPLVVKLAPDLGDAELEDALDVMLRTGMDGVIATNTTVSRQGVRSALAKEAGGLSGAPLQQHSTRIIQEINRLTGGKLPVIGVGGVMGAVEARQKLDSGAVLVQVYTGLVYTGPGLVKKILLGLAEG
jgi:dihydroorotate dehydrogenase